MIQTVSGEAFKIQKYFLTLAGIWPIPNPSLWYNIYGFFMTILIQNTFMVPSLLLFLNNIDFSRGAFILYCNIAVIGYQFKVAGFVIKRKTFANILNDLEQPLFKTDEYSDIIDQAVLLAKRITSIMYVPSILFALLLAIFPIFDHSTQRPLPFPTPYSVENIPYLLYLFIYFSGVIACGVATITNTNMDTSVYTLMILATAQLKVLGKTLPHVLSISTNSTSSTTKELESYGMLDELVFAKIKNCVKHHIEIIRYVDQVEDCFTYQLLAQFIASVFLICSSAFSFVVRPPTDVMFATSVSFFSIATIEIAIYCIFANQVIVESSNLGDCCYMADWNKCGPRVCKALFIMMERTKRPIVFTAGKFADLSHDSLITILKSSVSYFVIMKKLYGEDAGSK